MRRVPRLAVIVSGMLSLTVAACMFTMMALTVIDVSGRKLWNAPLRGSVELTELMMLGVVFAGLPLVTQKREHVLFDLLDHLLPKWSIGLMDLLANTLCAVLLLFTGWQVFVRAGRTAGLGDTTAQLAIPLAGFQYAVSVLIVVAALFHLAQLSRALRGGSAPES